MMMYDQEESQLTLTQDDRLTRGFVQDVGAWVQADEKEVSMEGKPASKVSFKDYDPETDNLVAQYFGDVRQFALLSRTEEQALWAQIEQRKARLRRALYTSPVALATLTQTPLQQRTRHDREAKDPQADFQRQCQAAVVTLHNLRTHLAELRERLRATTGAAPQRRELRQTWVRCWHQWLTTWEDLDLHPSVHEAIRLALEVELQAQPDHPALRAAHTAWLRAQRELEQAKVQMLRANLRLVIHVANRYRGRGVPFLDLIQEGNMGLMRALEKFEPHRGLKFVTYAHWWIRQAISRAVTEQHRTVRLPSHVVERKNKLRSVGDKLWDVHGRAPSTQELSVALGWTPKEVEELHLAVQPITRLHQPTTDDGDVLATVLEDVQAPRPETLVTKDQLHRRLAECLATLPEREALILRLRYGLGSDHAHSLKEIGDILGISRERVRQIEKLAFEKLRQPPLSALLVDFADVVEL